MMRLSNLSSHYSSAYQTTSSLGQSTTLRQYIYWCHLPVGDSEQIIVTRFRLADVDNLIFCGIGVLKHSINCLSNPDKVVALAQDIGLLGKNPYLINEIRAWHFPNTQFTTYQRRIALAAFSV